MFIQPCFIRKNTKDLRHKLEDIGYKLNIYDEGLDKYLFVERTTYISAPIVYNSVARSYIDCNENEELFLALASLRNDSDDKQWFIATQDCYAETYEGTFNVAFRENEWVFNEDENSHPSELPNLFRKATKEEIIEHFTK